MEGGDVILQVLVGCLKVVVDNNLLEEGGVLLQKVQLALSHIEPGQDLVLSLSSATTEALLKHLMGQRTDEHEASVQLGNLGNAGKKKKQQQTGLRVDEQQ